MAAPTSLNCDVLVIGSGLLGSTFARMAHDAGARVAMVDAGCFHSPRAGENRKNAWLAQRELVNYGHFVRSQLYAPSERSSPDLPGALVCYAVGGMAAHWTCAIPEFHPRLERPAMLVEAEWRTLYDAAARLLNRHDGVFSGSVRHRAIREALTQRGWSVRETPMAAERAPGSPVVTYTGADTILGPLAAPGASARFTILPEHVVRRLRTSVGGGRVEMVEILDVARGETVLARAGRVVLAAGWLYNAQLLWASDIHAHEGSALGRYLSDHTFANCTVTLDRALVEAIGAPAIPVDDAAPHLYLPVADDRPWQGMIFRESYQFAPDASPADAPTGIDLKWFGMIKPRRDNRVIFSAERLDRLGLPDPAFRLRLSEADQRLAAAMRADMAEAAAVLGRFRPGGEPAMMPLGSAIHATGLTRMGTAADDGATSVVNPQSQVWGCDNLFVGGTSVIPTPTAANPTLTAVALALKSAKVVAGG